jgi:hypothetical protein
MKYLTIEFRAGMILIFAFLLSLSSSGQTNKSTDQNKENSTITTDTIANIQNVLLNANDLRLISVISPSTGVNITEPQLVTFSIKNVGTAAQSNIPWEVTWTGELSGEITGTYSGTILPDSTIVIEAGFADISTIGTYVFEACVNNPGDAVPNNNCRTKTVRNNNPTISGKVRYNAGSGFINFTGAEINIPGVGVATANISGNFSIKVPAGYSGTITPIVCDESYYTFNPPSITLTNVQANISGNNFDATVTEMFTISGTITEKTSGQPLANTEVDFVTTVRYGYSSFVYKLTTNAAGEYSFDVLPCWSNPIDPRYPNFYIESTDGGFIRNYNAVFSDFSNQDYTYLDFDYPVPEAFNFLITGSTHTISIEGNSNPTLCGIPLELGGLIGAFYLDDNGELKCGGFGRWHDEYTESNVSVPAMGDDTGTGGTPEKDGFSFAEIINWFVYSYSRNEIFPASPSYESGGFLTSNNKWYPSGLSVMNELEVQFGNSIVIPEGWSGLSSFTPPASSIITNVMSPILDDLVLIQSTTGMYYPEMGINNLGVWTYNKGYKIKVANETVLSMPGCPHANRTVSLPAGWNIMPVLSPCNVLLTEALAPIMSRVKVVKDVAGNKIFWPEMGIETLKILEKNRAYYIYVTQSSSFTYGLCDTYKSAAIPTTNNPVNLTPWDAPQKTGFTHTIAITGEALAVAGHGDFIGAFTQDGQCAGLAMVDENEKTLALTAYGDDIFEAEKTGLSEGELLNFRLFKTGTGEEAMLLPAFDSEFPSHDGSFTDNGLSVIKSMEISAPGISTPVNPVGFYPNPTTGAVNFLLPRDGSYTIYLQDLSGRILQTNSISENQAVDYSAYPQGVYLLVIEGEEFRNFKKLILN